MTLDLFLSATPKLQKESIEFPDPELYAESFERNSLNFSRSSPDPENYRCDYQQSYNFFSEFTNFRRLPDKSGKPKSVDLKQKN